MAKAAAIQPGDVVVIDGEGPGLRVLVPAGTPVAYPLTLTVRKLPRRLSAGYVTFQAYDEEGRVFRLLAQAAADVITTSA
jgi:hypothetical protein